MKPSMRKQKQHLGVEEQVEDKINKMNWLEPRQLHQSARSRQRDRDRDKEAHNITVLFKRYNTKNGTPTN